MNYIYRLAVLAVCVTATSAASAAPPNIILILTDDHGWSQLSAPMDPDVPQARSSYLETPNMVRLLREGMRFTSGYAPAPLCTPTRRSILCGTSAARSGPEFRSDWVPAQHLTIPKALKSVDSSYRCAHFGKWGEQMLSTPEECGYDASDGETGNNTGGMPRTLGVDGGHNAGPPHFIDNEDPKLTKSVTSRAIDFMREQSRNDIPYFVQVSYYAQHLSVVTGETTLAKYEAKGTPDRGYTAAWAAMMEELDDGIGRLIDAADELAAGNTYVFFTADNGGRGTVPGGEESRAATNTPLIGAKQSLYEGGIRVPFVVRGPNAAAGSVCRTPVAGYDFLPTFHAIAGGTREDLSSDIDGVSIMPLLEGGDGESLQRPAGGIVFHRPERLFSALRAGPYKLMLFWTRGGEVSHHELYDLSRSPVEEGHDIALEDPATAKALQQDLLSYLESVDADLPSRARRRGASR